MSFYRFSLDRQNNDLEYTNVYIIIVLIKSDIRNKHIWHNKTDRGLYTMPLICFNYIYFGVIN